MTETAAPKNTAQHLVLETGVPLLRRDAHTYQLGLDTHRAVLIPATIATKLVAMCNGDHSFTDLVSALTHECAIEATVVVEILQKLLDNKLLLETGSQQRIMPTETTAPHMQIARIHAINESQTVAGQHTRLQTEVHIHGLGRLGMLVTTLLASSGFAHVRPHDKAVVSSADVTTFGAQRCDIGVRREYVALQIIERVHSGVTQRGHALKFLPTHRLDLFIPDSTADYPWFDPTLAQECLSSDSPFLMATHARDHALVSSVILPGQSGCIRCLHLHNTDRDSAWPLLATQLMGNSTADRSPMSLVLQTAILILDIVYQWIEYRFTARNHIYELAWPNPLPRIQLNPPHAQCGCSNL